MNHGESPVGAPMTRHDDTTLISTKGFWPNIDQEPFYKSQTPPWEVPRKRKTGGSNSRFNDSNTNKYESDHERIETKNRFYLLNPDLNLSESDNDTIPMNRKLMRKVENTPAEVNVHSNKKYDINCNLFPGIL